MNCKKVIVIALLLGWPLAARSSTPVTYKEIAMLLRNGEQQQFIIEDTTRRKLLQPLTQEEERDLVALGATPGLLDALHSSMVLASPKAALAYEAYVRRQARVAQQEEEQPHVVRIAPKTPTLSQPQQKPVINSGTEFLGKSLNLKFTAADGSAVDIGRLRGKVVLLDFWATWCGPCMGEVPNVVTAYKKYHDQGFEVIGISLDKSKETMLKVTQEKEMTWPQFFDGNGWQNQMSSSFHINAIPAMWLINKKGIIVSTDSRRTLDADVVRLLAE